MKIGDECSTGRRISLRGFERMASITNKVSSKLAHSMLVRGETMTILRYLPTAVLNTFNLHPRMRALQLSDNVFTAEIQAPVTSNDLSKLLQVTILTPADYGEGSPMSWQAFVEKECSLGFDRHTQFPFYLSVWIAQRKNSARFMLFSDQYMSDEYSGLVVLHCIIEQISILARRATTIKHPPMIMMKEYRLYPSLYRMWLKKLTWVKTLLKGTTALFGRRLFRDNVHKFKPLLCARNDQKDFAVPPLTNSTKALFADGEPKCMYEAFAKCKVEEATLHGVVIVVALLAFYHVKEGQGNLNPFRILVDVDCNMRQHVQELAKEESVGLFTASTELEWLHLEGIDIFTTCFWDLARRASHELEVTVQDTMAMAVATITADQKLNAKMPTSFLKNVLVAHSITSDVGITEVIQYPFKKHHVLTSAATDNTLSIESLHVYKALPHLAPSVTMFLSALNAFGYSMAHKVETEVGNKLFTVFVLICESLSSIGSDDKLIDVLTHLDE